MFNVGDRVVCISGAHKGKVGTYIRPSTDFEKKSRMIVQFDNYPYECNLWTHRFCPQNNKLAVIHKIKQMESRQTWKKNPV